MAWLIFDKEYDDDHPGRGAKEGRWLNPPPSDWPMEKPPPYPADDEDKETPNERA